MPKDTPQYVLDISSSISGRRWLWRNDEQIEQEDFISRVQDCVTRLKLPEITARLLIQRGYTIDQIPHFLDAKLKDLMPDPFSLKDMDKAATRMAKAIKNKETIGIFGDYDVDGICSSTILYRFFRSHGCQVITHIPDRIKEGYGPNKKALEELTHQGATLTICVDCGTASQTILNPLAQSQDIIVFDHHKSEDEIPKILAVVNPQRPDCTSHLSYLCATAVTFLAIVATTRVLCHEEILEPNYAKKQLALYLDLVALATICDVMPLKGANRAFVKQGLTIMGQRRRVGLKALMEQSSVTRDPTAFSCGFILGPRINSGGRIAQADLGLKLLTTEDRYQAEKFSSELDAVNQNRRNVENDVLENAIQLAQQQRDDGHQIIFLANKDWHPGIVGIIAGRIKERFNRPTLIGTITEDHHIKGSGRSVATLDLGSAIISARQKHIIVGGGGHAMAGGFTLKEDKKDAFHAFLEERLKEAANLPQVPDLLIDAILSIQGATYECAENIQNLAPFGPGNPEPVIALPRVYVAYSTRVGKDSNTLRMQLQGNDTARVNALLFKIDASLLRTILEDPTRPALHVAGQLRSEIWRDEKRVTFFIKDVARADPSS